MQDGYTVFVCSSDRFADCWNPFFSLFKKFWPGFSGEILLATETQSYQFPGLTITCPCVQKDTRRELTWSEIIYKSLDHVKTSHILLFLEDYFLKGPVDAQRLEQHFQRMRQENFDHQMLISMPGNNLPTPWPDLVERAKDAPYRISTQTGFWKTAVIRQYLRMHESPWQFEHWGTRRAARRNDRFYAIHPDDININGYIINYYIRGAVTKGRWQPTVPEFLKTHELELPDFSIRGFYDDAWMPPLPQRIRNRIRRIPSEIRSWWSVVFS